MKFGYYFNRCSETKPLLETYVMAINVLDPPYNAVGDGISDDTVAINQAIADAETAGGNKVRLPAPHVYKVSGLSIQGDNVSLVGDGAGSVIAMAQPTGDTITLGSIQQVHRIRIANLRFEPLVTRTAGSEINFWFFAVVNISDVSFSNCYQCLNFGHPTNKNLLSSTLNVGNIRARGFSVFCYTRQSIDMTFQSISTDAARNSANTWILDSWSEGTWTGVFGVNTVTPNTGNCLTIQREVTGVLHPPRYLKFVGCTFDSHATGLNATDGAWVTFEGCLFADRPGDGARVHANAIYYRFIGCEFVNCGTHGLLLNPPTNPDTAVDRNHAVIGCLANNNSYSYPGQGYGIAVGQKVKGFIIQGCEAFNSPTGLGGFGKNYHGLYLGPGTDRYIVTNNNFLNNDQGAILGKPANPSATQIILNNLE